MSGNRVMIAVLVILAVLFFAGVALGGRGGDQGIDLNQGWLRGLQGMLVVQEKLTTEDVDSVTPSGCLQGSALVLPAGGSCRLEIGEASAAVRTMSLRLAAGGAALLVLDQRQENTLTVKETLSASEPAIEIDVYREGATLSAVCSSLGGGCRLLLE